MSAPGQLRAWLRAVVLRQSSEAAMHAEMDAHMEQAAERWVARGLSAQDAMREARREFGNVAMLHEQSRDARGGRWIEQSLSDVRFAFRYFARTRVTSIAIVFTLTLGIGINTAMISIANGYVFRPAPGVPDDNRLALIHGQTSGDESHQTRLFSSQELAQYAALHSTFESVAGWTTSDMFADFGRDEDGVGSIRGQFVTPNYFTTLGIRLAAGPGFVQSRFDERAVPEFTAIVSYAVANEKLGGVAGAVGRHIKFNNVSMQVVGVAPPRFNGALHSNARRTVWFPISARQTIQNMDSSEFRNRDSTIFEAIGKLQPGVAMSDVGAIAQTIADRSDTVLSRVPNSPHALTRVFSLSGAYSAGMDGQIVSAAVVFGTILLLILLVCTTTVSSLLIGNGVTRAHEIAVRLSLGASRARVIRQLLIESSVLSLISAALGLATYAVVCRVLGQQLADADVAPNWVTALAVVAFAVAVAVVCGISPALHATGGALTNTLKNTGHGVTKKTRLQRAFVVAQIALTQPLLLGLAFTVMTEIRELNPDRDLAVSNHLVVANFDTWAAGPGTAAAQLPSLVKRYASLPGVVNAISKIDAYQIYPLELFEDDVVANRPRRFEVSATGVAPGNFKLLDVRVLNGREFTAADFTAPESPIILTSAAAHDMFGNRNPIGHRLYRIEHDKRVEVVHVVGVVPRQSDAVHREGSVPQIFTPERVSFGSIILVRTAEPAAQLIPTLRAIAKQEAHNVPLRSMQTLAQQEHQARAQVMQVSGTLAICGLLTLLIASIGLYAVVALSVAQRTREIGVRIAVGAFPSQVVRMFFGSGVRLSMYGMIVGLPASVIGLKLLSVQVGLPEVNVPVVVLSVAAVVVGVASFATWLPARRAAGVDPIVALRAE